MDQMKYSVEKRSTARWEDGPLGRAARTSGAEAPACVLVGAGASRLLNNDIV